ncbi:hypothetical protein [Xanthomonas fragariae]|nr:hypothetical protein [Xanthomonas fragariae]
MYGYDQITPQWLLSANLAMITGAPFSPLGTSSRVAPEKPQPPNDRKALMSAPACQNYQCSLR